MSLRNQWRAKGRLGRDPEVIELSEGRYKVKFSIAVTEYIKGEDKTFWFNVVAFDRTANKVINRKVGKGDYIEILGPLRPYEYTLQSGETRREINILLDDFDILSRSKNNERPAPIDAIRKDESAGERKQSSNPWVNVINVTKETNSFMNNPWEKYDPKKDDIPF
jgi:single stranded DNA-binding protein